MKRLVKVIAAVAAAVSVAAVSAVPTEAFEINMKNVTYMLKGDINKDKMITLRDATLCQKFSLLSDDVLAGMADWQKYTADMDGSYTVTVSDAYLIQRFATHDKAVLEGDGTIPAYCRNRMRRLEFYEALNADRVSKGLAAYSYNDAVMSAGQELCDAWYEERTATLATKFSGYRKIVDHDEVMKEFGTVFYDYGFEGYDSNGIIATPYGETQSGAAYYNVIKNGSASNNVYKKLYNEVLMASSPTAICVGERLTDEAALWVVTGY